MVYIPYNNIILKIKRKDTMTELFEIIVYTKIDGTKPVEEFLQNVEIKMRAKIFREISLLKQNGNELREPHTKHLDDAIFELPIKLGSNISRVLYFFMIGRKIILTNAFIKKTHKTPLNEITLAKKYREDFNNRNQGGGNNV